MGKQKASKDKFNFELLIVHFNGLRAGNASNKKVHLVMNTGGEVKDL